MSAPLSDAGLPLADSLEPRTADEYAKSPQKTIYSATPKEAFHAKVLESFPPPNCWHLYEKLLSKWGTSAAQKLENSKQNSTYSHQSLLVWGVAGTGKTSTIDAVADLIFNKKPVYFNAGGRALNELLIETKLSKEHKNIPTLIEEAYFKKTLSPNSLSFLREKFPTAFTINAENQEEDLCMSDPYICSFLTPKNIEALEAVAKMEGILDSSSSLGVHYVEGPLIKACREGRILIADEVDKSLEEGSNKLSEVMQAINGSIPEFTFEEQNIKFTFDRKKTIHPDFDIVYTANDMSNGTASNWAGQHLLQRVESLYIPPNGIEELTTRILQTLLGFNPVPLIASQNIKNKALVAQAIFQLAGKPLSDQAINLLEKLPKTLQASQQLACMFHSWSKITDPELSTDETLAASRYVFARDISVRYAQQVLREALSYVEELPIGSDELIPVEAETLDEALAALCEALEARPASNVHEISLGQAIQTVVQSRLASFPCEGHTLLSLLKAAQITQVISPEALEDENAHSGKVAPITDLLNTLENELTISPSTYKLRDLFVQILVKKSPALADIPPDLIIPPKTLQLTLDRCKVEAKEHSAVSYTVGLTPNYIQSKNASPLCLIPILDQSTHKDIITKAKNKRGSTLRELLSSTEGLEASLQNPTIRKTFMDGIWHPSQIPPGALDPNLLDIPLEEAILPLLFGNDFLQSARILTTSEDNTICPTILLQSKNTNAFIAYCEGFQGSYLENKTLLTNNSEEAARFLADTFKSPEERRLVTANLICLSSKNPLVGKNNEQIEDENTIAARIEEFQDTFTQNAFDGNKPEEDTILGFSLYLKKAYKHDYRVALHPSKLLLLEKPIGL